MRLTCLIALSKSVWSSSSVKQDSWDINAAIPTRFLAVMPAPGSRGGWSLVIRELVLPLRDWTHEDVWQYIEDNDVPYDKARYVKTDGVWGERAGQLYNADYVHACTACLDRESGEKVVHCPKLGFEIESNVNKVPWVEPEKVQLYEGLSFIEYQ